MLLLHEMLRLKFLGYSQAEICRSTGHSRTSIGKVLNRVKELNIPIQELLEKTDVEVHERLFPEEIVGSGKRMPDFDALRKELNRHGVTKTLLWQEYVRECEQLGAQAYGRSQFFQLFQLDDARANVTAHIIRKPGISMEVDWSGDFVPYYDGSTEKSLKAHIFVAALSFSQYMYVEAFHDEQLASWIQAHIHAFEFFGGVTREIIPDNCKTAVLLNDVDGITLNATYREMSEYYKTIVLPARVKKPRDKPNAESGVGLTQRQILAPLRDQQFFSLAELNRAIRNQLDIVNGQPFQKKEGSRREVFEKEEKDLLIALPAVPFEMAEWKVATVQCSSHISADKKMYSVPSTYIGKKVDVKISRLCIEVYYRHSRIAVHQRSYDPKQRYVTINSHLPEGKQNTAKWNGASLREWAEKIGPFTHTAVSMLLSAAKYEQHAYRTCLALLSLSKAYSESLLELACKETIDSAGKVTFRLIKARIKLLSIKPKRNHKPHNEEETAASNQYGVTRGAEYFERSNS